MRMNTLVQEPTAVYLVNIPTSGYGRGISQGIHEYGMTRPDWYYFSVSVAREDMPGVIGYFGDADQVRALRQAGVPLVNVSAARREVSAPRVVADDRAVGRLAAEHLMGLGLRHFACIRPFGLAFSDDRHAGFAEVLDEVTQQARARHEPHMRQNGSAHEFNL